LSDHLSDILERVKENGEDFVIEKDGEPLARLAPTARGTATWQTLADIFERYPPDPEFADDLENVHKSQPPMPPDPWQTS
jgi:antitoxin (DNA-binding transcriptional repressor) of toxin-antitoxin stability system